MSAVRVHAGELYPVYSLQDRYGHEVEATPEQVARWVAATEAFKAAQSEMGELYEAAETAEVERKQQQKERAEAERKAAEDAERKERQRAQRKAEKARAKLKDQLAASGGVVYDAEGKPLGVASASRDGLRLGPVDS